MNSLKLFDSILLGGFPNISCRQLFLLLRNRYYNDNDNDDNDDDKDDDESVMIMIIMLVVIRKAGKDSETRPDDPIRFEDGTMLLVIVAKSYWPRLHCSSFHCFRVQIWQ